MTTNATSSSRVGHRLRALLQTSAALSVVALAATPHIAAAQAAAPTLGEVVVTAQKVETTVQRTALAVDVYGASELQSQGVHDIAGLANIAPAVNISGTGAGTVVTMRGISSRDTTEVGDPAVAINVDGFYQDRSYAIGLTQFDLDRVEVVKGPQGTLSGRNATAGAINIITAKPSHEFGGYVTIDAGSFNTLNTEGAVNVPLGDKVQMRASFSTVFHDGYRNSGPIAGRTDDQNARSGRVQLSWQPIDNLRLHVLAQQTTQKTNGSFAKVFPYAVDANGFVAHVQPAIGDSTFYSAPAPSSISLQDQAYRWDVIATLPFATASYFGGYDDLTFHGFANASTYNAPVGFNPVLTPAQFNQNEEPKTWNHEVRLTSLDSNARLTWQVGAFYFEDSNELFSINKQYPSNAPVIAFRYSVGFKSLSEFGQIAFKPTEDIKITLGARHNKDDKTRHGFIFFGANPNGAPTNGQSSTDKSTYHLGLDWQITPRSLLYAKADTGYKAGGFTDVAPYGPETVTTYEVGSKNRFMDNRLQLNADFFYSDYLGQQVNQFVAFGGGTQIVNAGKTRLYGIEADGVGILPFGRVELNAAWLHAKFIDFPIGLQPAKWNGVAWGTAPAANVNLAGNKPPQAPEWTIGGSFEHAFDVAGGRLTGRVSTKYTTEQFFTFFNRPDERQAPYALTNLLFTYAPDAAKWQLQAYVNNLSNVVSFANAAEGDRGHNYAYSFIAPRTYGARFTARF
jgi:iron complex outermembrane receptor protein